MVQARTAGRPGCAAAPSKPGTRLADTDRLREHIAALLLEAASFVAPARVEETARGWLAHAEPGWLLWGSGVVMRVVLLARIWCDTNWLIC